MANSYFRFQQFTVEQDRCAMKVGTDGTLLGAWAEGGLRVLDIGSGTGLVSLMMCQRFPQSRVVGVEIDSEAHAQSLSNARLSPFADRIELFNADVRTFCPAEHFDAIVSNPPFFQNSLQCPDPRRSTARHGCTLSYGELMAAVVRLLTVDGTFSVVVPSDCRHAVEQAARSAGLFAARVCSVHTTPAKPPRRCLMSFGRSEVVPEVIAVVLEDSPGVRSEWYKELTKHFYL